MKKIFSALGMTLAGLLAVTSCNNSGNTTSSTTNQITTNKPTTATPTTESSTTVKPTTVTTTTTNAGNTSTTTTTPGPVELEPTTLFMIGDSTCAPYDQTKSDLDFYYQRAGFGDYIGYYLDEAVTVKNLAVGGASSKSFPIDEKTSDEYATFKNELSEGDYVIIAFGHNDEKKDSSKFSTLENDGIDNEGTFQYNLYHNFISYALEKGAIPILATPIARYDSNGTYAAGSKYVHCMEETTDYGGGDYAQSVRNLANDLDLTLIDNTTMTADALRDLGAEAAKEYYGWPSSTTIDGTHLNTYGAHCVAYMMANALKSSTSTLGQYVRNDITAPTKEEYLKVNPLYVEPTYQAPTEWSNIWNTTDGWHGSVFGTTKSSKLTVSSENYTITENADDTVTLEDQNVNPTRMNSTGESFVMYFQQLDINSSFVFEATVTLNYAGDASNYGFGLQVRDDMYIDEYVAGMASQQISVGNLGTTFKSSNGDRYTYNAWNREALAEDETPTINKVSGDRNTDYCAIGETITLRIEKIDSTYSLYYNGVKTALSPDQILAGNDKQYIYVGCFVSGDVKATFSNISLVVNEN